MTKPTHADGGGTVRRGDPSKHARPKPLAELLDTTPLSRHHDPVEIAAVYGLYGHDRQEEVRAYCRRLDSGRYWTYLDDLHRWMSHLDLTGRSWAEDVLSEETVAWLKTYGYVEEVNRFPRLEPEDWEKNVRARKIDLKKLEDAEVNP